MALIALARIDDRRDAQGRSRFAALMRPFLADSKQEISETAALALGILGQDESAPLLAALLRNEPMAIEAVGSSEVSFRTRAFAAYGLTLLSRRNSNPDIGASPTCCRASAGTAPGALLAQLDELL